MRIYLAFTHDEIIEKIPYALICETMEGARWNTAKRRRLMKERFSDEEISRFYEFKNLAHRWHLGKGVPVEVKMTFGSFRLWQRLGDFCAEL